MAVEARAGRRWAGRRAPVVAALLALLLIPPIGALFLAQWRDLADQASAANQERQGIEYISTLGELTVTLVDAQSTAINGRAIPRHTLARAVAATDEVDARLGASLRVSERWAQLRDQIERLAEAEATDPQATYLAYLEVTELLLDLYHKLRETSGLIRDADADSHYLQAGAAEDLPAALVAGGRLVDLVAVAAAAAAAGAEQVDPTVAGSQPEPPESDPTESDPTESDPDPARLAAEQAAQQRAAFAAQVSVARVALVSPADALNVNIQAALDSTQSRTLSGNVLSSFDRFLREKDGLLTMVVPGLEPAAIDLEALDRLRVDLQAATTDLFHALMTELDGLILARIDDLERQQWIAAGLAAAAALLALCVIWASLVSARSPLRLRAGQADPPGGQAGGADRRGVPRAGSGPESGEVVQAELIEWERSGAR